MDDADFLPNDLDECQRLLLAAFKESVELERQVAAAKRHAAQAEQRVTESEQQAAELSRVSGWRLCGAASTAADSRRDRWTWADYGSVRR